MSDGQSSWSCSPWTATISQIVASPMGFDFHRLHYQITSIGQMLIGIGDCRLIYQSGNFHSIVNAPKYVTYLIKICLKEV
jgi:hypothetical protein